MRQYPLPNYEEGQGVEEYLLTLYEVGGFTRRHGDEVDPSLIKVNPDDWKKICETIIQDTDYQDKSRIGLFFMNYGPSSDSACPKGQVRFYAGAIVKNEEVRA